MRSNRDQYEEVDNGSFHLMLDDNQQTQSIPVNDPRLQQMLDALDDSEGTASLTSFNEVLLLIQNAILRLVVRDEQTYFLGRFSGSEEESHIDLTHYNALQHGISRVHAKLIMRDHKLYIVDMGSTNGTYVGKKRLKPDEPALLHRGDELLLARMRIQIMFR
ncbi:MAG: FHA domain-containing protein [Chloroflexota bacterium]